MKDKFIASDDCWFIINSEGTIHHGKIEKDSFIETKNEVQTFLIEDEWKIALKTLGVKLESKPEGIIFGSKDPKSNPFHESYKRRLNQEEN